MNMALEIPKEDTGAIAAIRTLSPALIEKLVAAINSSPPVSSPREMVQHVAEEIPSIPVDKLNSMIETLYTLYHIRELSGVPSGRFLEDLIEGIQNSPHLPSPQKDLSQLHNLLDKLLNIETLRTVSKAARLQRDGERLYCEAKVLSDIRPVFGENPLDPPLGAVLTNTLRIGYHGGSQRGDCSRSG
jgi:hypothetical protein